MFCTVDVHARLTGCLPSRYKSLKANLVHCSDLGRKAFREAEARMKRMTLVAQAVCEPDGTVCPQRNSDVPGVTDIVLIVYDATVLD